MITTKKDMNEHVGRMISNRVAKIARSGNPLARRHTTQTMERYMGPVKTDRRPILSGRRSGNIWGQQGPLYRRWWDKRSNEAIKAENKRMRMGGVPVHLDGKYRREIIETTCNFCWERRVIDVSNCPSLNEIERVQDCRCGFTLYMSNILGKVWLARQGVWASI